MVVFGPRVRTKTANLVMGRQNLQRFSSKYQNLSMVWDTARSYAPIARPHAAVSYFIYTVTSYLPFCPVACVAVGRHSSVTAKVTARDFTSTTKALGRAGNGIETAAKGANWLAGGKPFCFIYHPK